MENFDINETLKININISDSIKETIIITKYYFMAENMENLKKYIKDIDLKENSVSVILRKGFKFNDILTEQFLLDLILLNINQYLLVNVYRDFNKERIYLNYLREKFIKLDYRILK